MKKTYLAACTLAVTALMNVTIYAESPSVYYNGEKMEFEAEPYITNERTMVPFRAIFEKAGADVVWDGDTQTVVAAKQSGDKTTVVTLQIGNTTAFVDGVECELDAPAELTNDFTYVPLRFVMQSLGADVEWNQETYTVSITAE